MIVTAAFLWSVISPFDSFTDSVHGEQEQPLKGVAP